MSRYSIHSLISRLRIALLIELLGDPGFPSRWCSLFNADLALSVTMTAISTILSIFTLPVNLLLYANLAYEADVTAQLDWRSVFIALVVVISAIALGLFCSARSKSAKFNIMANKVRVFYCQTPTRLYSFSQSSSFHEVDRKHCRIFTDCFFCDCDKYW